RRCHGARPWPKGGREKQDRGTTRQKVKVLHRGVLRAAGVRVRVARCLAAHHTMGEGKPAAQKKNA
ncbi:unnamed protein product, partial [Ectocarpus sp. 4 AP-2014]